MTKSPAAISRAVDHMMVEIKELDAEDGDPYLGRICSDLTRIWCRCFGTKVPSQRTVGIK